MRELCVQDRSCVSTLANIFTADATDDRLGWGVAGQFWFWYRTIASRERKKNTTKCLFILFALAVADSCFRSLLFFFHFTVPFARSFFLVCAQIIWNGNDASESQARKWYTTVCSWSETSPYFRLPFYVRRRVCLLLILQPISVGSLYSVQPAR